MKLPISARLLACCDYIAPGDRVADIGCDHGYLGIYLLLNGISPHTIEADIRPGPLSAAVKNGEKYGVHSLRRPLAAKWPVPAGAPMPVEDPRSAKISQRNRLAHSAGAGAARRTVPLHRHGLCLGAGTDPDPRAVLPLPRPPGKRLPPAAGIHRLGPGPSGPQCPEPGRQGGSL